MLNAVEPSETTYRKVYFMHCHICHVLSELKVLFVPQLTFRGFLWIFDKKCCCFT